MSDSNNLLISDRDVDFLLYEVFDIERLCELPYFADHSRETFNLFLSSTRRFSRDVLLPTYRPVDEEPAKFIGGRIKVHPLLHKVIPQMVELGVLSATRPAEVGGQQLPITVSAMANAYLMAANLSASGFLWLTTGAAHLIEAFGNDWLKDEFMARMYSGEYTGTMALTEPGAGSSLSDVRTKAIPTGDGHYLIEGSKIFISGGDHDLVENVVHLTLARIEGAPPGIKGVSLFAVPRMRREGEQLVFNDVNTAGAVHKIGWRGLPSLVLNYGESGDCRGWLVGEPNRGINYMFQMMNEARIMVGFNGAATAAVAYQDSLAYARNRPQGRPLQAKDPQSPQVPIIQHADVRRMLLRQKAIVEGAFSLLIVTSIFADRAAHEIDEGERHRAQLLLDLLTPVAKSFPAEWGFESNALAVQILGGYGYTSEYLPEAWMRDQKLNSIHEGTTGIQSMDLLGRKVLAEQGAAMRFFREELEAACKRARDASVNDNWVERLESALEEVESLTMTLAGFGVQGEPERMMRHSVHYLQMFSILVVGWQWLLQAAVASEGKERESGDASFYEGKLRAAQYWFATEVPRIASLAELIRSEDDSFANMRDEWF